MLKANSNQLKTMQRTMSPPTHHSNRATPELPVKNNTFTGWTKMPVPMVRFMIKQTTVKRPRRCIDVGETSKRYFSSESKVYAIEAEWNHTCFCLL